MKTTFLALLPFLPLAARAWNPENRDCDDRPLCLTSFKWCDPHQNHDCSYPDEVYPQASYGGPFPTLIWGAEYKITWKLQDPLNTDPVTIEWVFDGEEESDGGVRWRSSMLHPSTSFAAFRIARAHNSSAHRTASPPSQPIVDRHGGK